MDACKEFPGERLKLNLHKQTNTDEKLHNESIPTETRKKCQFEGEKTVTEKEASIC